MVPVSRFSVLFLALVCWIGWRHDCASGGDSPTLSGLPGNGASGESGYPAGNGQRSRVFQTPADDTIPPDAYYAPELHFEQMPAGPVAGEYVVMGEDAWEDPCCGPLRSGLFARQPLRQHLRALYGTPQGRHRGLGQPLTSESWLYRPLNAGWFMGAMIGSPLIDDWLGISNGYSTGFRFGWDQNHYWGLDMQFTYAEMGLWDSARAKEERRQWYIHDGMEPEDPSLDRLVNVSRNLKLYQWAVSVMYYPWGDARWRPYLSLGVGATRMQYTDIFLTGGHQTFFVLPMAVGIKYHWNDWLALRFECSDSFSIPGGGGLKPVHNLSINGALEIRFGGPRTAYWPWNPGKSYW